MISPTSPRCTASGLMITNVRSTATECFLPSQPTPSRINTSLSSRSYHTFLRAARIAHRSRFTTRSLTLGSHVQPARRASFLRPVAGLFQRPERDRNGDNQRNPDRRRCQQPLVSLHGCPFICFGQQSFIPRGYSARRTMGLPIVRTSTGLRRLVGPARHFP